MTETTYSWIKKVAKELKKHAERDDCYNCKRLLKFSLIEAFLKAEEEVEA